jgi:hypothetical protein
MFCCVFVVQAQMTEVSGKVIANSDVENVHVINNTSRKFTTTRATGDFKIQAKLNDTLVFSSIQYKLKIVLVDLVIITNKSLVVYLTDHLTELDQVIVGSVLTKDLESDIENSKATPKINFHDVGIPGYQGKKPTQKERLLIEADNGKLFYYYGIGFAVNIHKLLNKVSGRTKKLKTLVRLEKRDELMYTLKAQFSESVFQAEILSEQQKMEFFFFCSEDEKFMIIGGSKNDIEILDFFQSKFETYKHNLKEARD